MTMGCVLYPFKVSTLAPPGGKICSAINLQNVLLGMSNSHNRSYIKVLTDSHGEL